MIPNLKTSTVVSDIMGRLNSHTVDNSDVEVYLLEYPSEYTSDSVTWTYYNPIKSIKYDEMDQLLELFHPEHDDDLFYVYLQMLQVIDGNYRIITLF